MNFGDILDEWERQNKKRADSKERPKDGVGPGEYPGGPSSRNEETPPRQVDPLSAWLRINGVYDKDADAEEAEYSKAERRRRLLRKKPDAVIDLHGLTRDDAWSAMDVFFLDARKKAFDKILIIHGKGNHSEGEAVLKRTVREYIERCPYAGEHGQGDSASGGSGSTWVILKEGKQK
ncbi:Smr/MutS family protein [Treponema sp. OttesenSCG-928-L16]|nr:Smr/MutS family protein [Treponema sp. OttesenSCG-928-L16]